MTGWHGEQWDFQNNEKTMEHSDHLIMTGWHGEQWDFQNNQEDITYGYLRVSHSNAIIIPHDIIRFFLLATIHCKICFQVQDLRRETGLRE
jgi:hypothetical protein